MITFTFIYILGAIGVLIGLFGGWTTEESLGDKIGMAVKGAIIFGMVAGMVGLFVDVVISTI